MIIDSSRALWFWKLAHHACIVQEHYTSFLFFVFVETHWRLIFILRKYRNVIEIRLYSWNNRLKVSFFKCLSWSDLWVSHSARARTRHGSESTAWKRKPREYRASCNLTRILFIHLFICLLFHFLTHCNWSNCVFTNLGFLLYICNLCPER